MRKLGICSLVLVVVLLVAAGSSFAVNRVVPTTYPTITAALAAALPAGDIIYVKPGVYVEDVAVTKSVRILSTAGKFRTFVQSTLSTTSAFTVIANNVVISGFTIWGGNDAFGVGIGLAANNVKVLNCIVEKSGFGILVTNGAANVTISGNIIRYCTSYAGGLNQGAGIYVRSSGGAISNVIIAANQIYDNDWFGILVYGSAGTPDFAGMRLNSNTLVNNGAFDVDFPVGPPVEINDHNWNLLAVAFVNVHCASGTIALNYNRIQTLFGTGAEFWKTGGSTATFSGIGNQQFSSCNKTIGGIPTPLPTP